MSETMPRVIETGTKFAKIIPGTSATVDVVFTHANVPAGTFNLERTGARLNSKILLNMKANDCYQRGVPGVADSLKGVAVWLRERIAELGACYVRSIGISAGASAAIYFGHAIDADTVIAIAPELQLGQPGYRSYDWNPVKIYHVRDLTNIAAALGARLNVAFPAWDVSDYRHIHAVMRHGGARMCFLPDMHNGAKEINWRRLAAAPGAVDLAEMTLRGTYEFRFGLEELWQGVAGFEAIGRADRFAAGMFAGLLEIDPENPGLCYQAALQCLLTGRREEAAALWLRAAAGMASTPLPLGKRYVEYERLVEAPAFAALTAFVEEMAPALPPVAPGAPNWMAAW